MKAINPVIIKDTNVEQQEPELSKCKLHVMIIDFKIQHLLHYYIETLYHSWKKYMGYHYAWLW